MYIYMYIHIYVEEYSKYVTNLCQPNFFKYWAALCSVFTIHFCYGRFRYLSFIMLKIYASAIIKYLLHFELFPWWQHFINIYSDISVCDITVVLCSYLTLIWRNMDESFISFISLKKKYCQANNHPLRNGKQNLPFPSTSWNTQMLWQRKKYAVSIWW